MLSGIPLLLIVHSKMMSCKFGYFSEHCLGVRLHIPYEYETDLSFPYTKADFQIPNASCNPIINQCTQTLYDEINMMLNY